MLTSDVSGSLLSPVDLWPAGKVYDITERMDQMMLQDIPTDRIELVHMCIVGKPGSGKTQAVKCIASRAFKKYGSQLQIVNTDSLPVAIEQMDGKKSVILLFIDDASGNASSRTVFEQVEVIKDFNTLRHILMDKQSDGRCGIVFVIFSWQRLVDLDPALRDGTYMIFKTGSSSLRDTAVIEDYLGTDYTDILYDNWYEISKGDQDAKGRSVALIAPLQRRQSGVGIYRTELVDFPEWPDIIRANEYYNDDALYSTFIEQHSAEEKWKLAIECYNLQSNAAGNGEPMTQSQIAAELGIMQGTVSKLLTRLQRAVRKG